MYVHPFAEEMNKSRRMAAMQARALAGAGYAVLNVDLLGCGDSSGDFGDATWDDWVADVAEAARWLQGQHTAPIWLWGLRTGALLAVAAAARLEQPTQLLFWQPATSGKTVLQQFLRLATAGSMLDGGPKGVTDGLRNKLAHGEAIDVAGYRLSSALASGLERATLTPVSSVARVEWFEVHRQARDGLSPAGALAAAQWQQGGVDVAAHVVEGPEFWQTTEIEEAPTLIEQTCAALDARAQPHGGNATGALHPATALPANAGT
jgi:exosortase A-associated hydrolase 2